MKYENVDYVAHSIDELRGIIKAMPGTEDGYVTVKRDSILAVIDYAIEVTKTCSR